MRVPPRRLYLDTARLGLMCQGAQRALNDFAKLLSEEGLSLYATRWLVHGDEQPHANFRRQISCWPGINGLKVAVGDFVGAPAAASILFANRSRALADTAIHLLATRCRRPLIVDLLWPPYQQLAMAACRSSAAKPSIVRLRRQVFHHQIGAEELIDILSAHYRRNGCDGLLLPSVSHDGARLPVAEIHRRVNDFRSPRLVVIDGAQGFAHTDGPDVVSAADVYLASAHKWLRAGLPLGIAIVANASIRQQMLCTNSSRSHSGDSLLRFLEELPSGRLSPFGETVDIASLVTCFGAIVDANRLAPTANAVQQNNRQCLADDVQETNWELRETSEGLRSGIMLIRAPVDHSRRPNAAAMRRAFERDAIAVTCYPGGQVRLSAGRDARLLSRDHTRLRFALQTVAGRTATPPASVDALLDRSTEAQLDTVVPPQ